MQENEVVVIEGAGSPDEITLHASDHVNLRTAKEAHAACMLVTDTDTDTDIDTDRCGAFAHRFGTHQLLPADERALIRGFVLNRFRGDAALLAPGPQQLQALTGVPTIAVLPMWRGHGLPEEDGVFDDAARGPNEGMRVAVVEFPRISNLDEFQPLRDLLGEWLADPDGLEGSAATRRGLGLLPLHTRFEAPKLLRRTRARFGATRGAWGPLAEVAFDGYEIRHGRTSFVGTIDAAALDADADADADAIDAAAIDGVAHAATIALRNHAGEPIGWQRGNVLGICVHGLFESPAILRALFGAVPRPLDAVFDGLADFIDLHARPGAWTDLLEPPPSSPVSPLSLPPTASP